MHGKCIGEMHRNHRDVGGELMEHVCHVDQRARAYMHGAYAERSLSAGRARAGHDTVSRLPGVMYPGDRERPRNQHTGTGHGSDHDEDGDRDHVRSASVCHRFGLLLRPRGRCGTRQIDRSGKWSRLFNSPLPPNLAILYDR